MCKSTILSLQFQLDEYADILPYYQFFKRFSQELVWRVNTNNITMYSVHFNNTSACANKRNAE